MKKDDVKIDEQRSKDVARSRARKQRVKDAGRHLLYVDVAPQTNATLSAMAVLKGKTKGEVIDELLAKSKRPY